MSANLHIRVDNRLLHGQVVQFWIPYLEVERLIIADDETAQSPAMSAVYRMAVPGRVELHVVSVAALPALLEEAEAVCTLVLISDVFDMARALMCGVEATRIVLGNVHSSRGRERVTDSVYLSREEQDALLRFTLDGGTVEIQTFPGECLTLAAGEDGVPNWLKR